MKSLHNPGLTVDDNLAHDPKKGRARSRNHRSSIVSGSFSVYAILLDHVFIQLYA